MRAHRRVALIAAVALFLAPLACAAADAMLPPIDDLGALATTVARTRVPVIVLFSTPGCPFCREVRQNYLAPRLAEQQQRSAPEYLLREVDITSRRTIGAIDEKVLTESQFADRYGIRLAPVVIAFDAKWRPIGEPLVGLDRSGFYESYIERLISEAQRQAAGR
jgi:thiol-disulfide isomerase/thioredoxin